MPKPVIKSWGEITPRDLDACPVWVNCHTADENEEWYDETVEDDYRPFTGVLDLADDRNMCLVKSDAVMSDGTRLSAFLHLIPAFDADDPGAVTAGIFVRDGRSMDLGPATMGQSEAVLTRRLDALGRSETEIFPVRVTPDDPALPVVVVLNWFAQRIEWPDGRTVSTPVRDRLRGRVRTYLLRRRRSKP